MNNKIIGVVGFIGSGKNTVGDYLVDNHTFVKMSFAHTLKNAISEIFGWPRNLLEGDTTESRNWRESVDKFWSNKLKKDITPRWVLQYFGTEVMRNTFNDNIWIWSLERQLSQHNQNCVITDVRFQNEISMIYNLGGTIIWVRRDPEPEWISTALNNKDQMDTLYPSIHKSEYSWINEGQFITIYNNNDLKTLYENIEKCLSNI